MSNLFERHMSENWARLDVTVHHLVLQAFTQLQQATDHLRILQKHITVRQHTTNVFTAIIL